MMSSFTRNLFVVVVIPTFLTSLLLILSFTETPDVIRKKSSLASIIFSYNLTSSGEEVITCAYAYSGPKKVLKITYEVDFKKFLGLNVVLECNIVPQAVPMFQMVSTFAVICVQRHQGIKILYQNLCLNIIN